MDAVLAPSNDLRPVLPDQTGMLRLQDVAITYMLSDWLRKDVQRYLHKEVIANNGQLFRKSPDEFATWLERLETRFPARAVAFGAAGCILGAAAIAALAKFGPKKAPTSSAPTADCQEASSRIAILGGPAAGAAGGVALAYFGPLRRSVYEVAAAATEMDAALEQLTLHLLQQYRVLIRQPLRAAVQELVYGNVVAAEGGEGAVQPASVRSLQQVVAGVAQLRGYLAAICRSQAADAEN